jgi:signal transduction histidine kinase
MMRAKEPPAERLDAGTTLALAHALRTPLTSLALGLGLLDDGALGVLNEAQHEVVRVLVADVARLSLLVDRRLETERLGAYAGPIERARIDLAELTLRAVAPIVRQAQDRGVRVDLALPSLISVVADPVKLAWVVASLMGNALRYSPPGASIDVFLARAGDEAELRIHDHGPGIAPEARARIFDRDGGPGLFLAREIVEAHGGRIQVSSEPGRGSVFTVTLPAASV